MRPPVTGRTCCSALISLTSVRSSHLRPAVEMLLLHAQELGKQFRIEVVVRSQQGSVAAIESLAKRFYGLQYHPEVLSRDPFPASSLQGGSKSFSEKAKVG
ncbi:hypothetical protein ACFX13_022836 [Malus domestica]